MLDITTLRGLSQAEQLKMAEAYAGVGAGVLSGVWKKETNQGQHPTMVGPSTKWGTAKGHFQVLDNIHANIEARVGKKLDRFDFTEGLVGAAEIMKENRALYGNDADAVSAYHGGWNKKNWGPATKDYVQGVLAFAGVATAPTVGQPSKRNPTGSTTEQWMAGTAPVTQRDVKSSAADAATRFAIRATPSVEIAQGNDAKVESAQQAAQAMQSAEAKRQAQDFWGLNDRSTTLGAAYSNTLRPAFNALAHMLTPETQSVDREYTRKLAEDPTAVLSLIQNPTPEEVQALMETTSTADLTLALGNINTRREDTAIMANAGTGAQLGAGFIAGALDPMTWATGLGATKALAAAGLGTVSLVNAGRPVAAIGALAGENILGGVAYEAAQQLLGEHKSAADYGLAAATGLLPAALMAPGVHRAGIVAIQRGAARQALEAQRGFLEKAVAELGADAEPGAVSQRALELEAQALRQDKAGRTASPSRGQRLDAPDLDGPQPEGDVQSMAFPEEQHPLRQFQKDAEDKTETAYAAVEGMTLNESRLAELGLSGKVDDIKAAKPGVYLDAKVADDGWFKAQADNLEFLRAKYAPSVAIHLTDNRLSSVAKNQKTDGFAALMAPGQHAIAVTPGSQGMWTMTHEFGHALLEQYLPSLPPEIALGMRRDYLTWLADADSVSGVRTRMGVSRGETQGVMGSMIRGEGNSWKAGLTAALGPERAATYDRYFKSFDEFAAEQFVKQVESDLAAATARADASMPRQMLLAFQGMVKRLLGLWKDLTAMGLTKPGEGFQEFFAAAARKELRATGTAGGVKADMKPTPAADHLTDTVQQYGLDTMDVSDTKGRARQKALAQLIYDSEAWLKANPQDVDKFRTIMKNSLFDARTPGLILAESDNPVAKAVAGILVENTMGGSGRNVTAALRKAQWEREFVGNSIVATGIHYRVFRDKKVGAMKGIIDDLSDANIRKEFNDAVAVEVESRIWDRDVGSAPEVKAAADALEVSYERMRKAQLDVRTVGWGALPDTARGYMPHVTNKRVWLTLGEDRKRALHGALSEQFREIEGMDAAFADKVASKYMDHISVNANGGHEIPANVHDPMALDYVNEALKAAGMTKAEIDEFAKRMARGGPSHTKKRLKLDLLKEYKDDKGETFRLLDLMETDQVELMRSQARRVSGEVALTQHGVMGSAGMRLLREAMEKAHKSGADPKKHAQAMEAFDQIGAEFLGRPFGDEMPTFMEGALTANVASNLGFMGWMQMGELINTATGLGVLDTMKMVADFPRIMQEVKVLAKGGKVENGILGSLEVSGAEFGLAGYKMVTQYDNPSSAYAAVGRQDSGPVIKSIRVAGHHLGTVSLQRIIQATQVRGVAEQITKKALRYIKEGVESKALADMGFTPDMVARLKEELPRIAKFENGVLASLDMTKAADPALAGEFIAAINRGAGQLIQDTFIGEKGKWQHHTVGKMLTQFRSFPITAMEKQWGRMRGMHGAPAALGIIMAAAPLGMAMYAARTAINSIGRPDQDEYIERAFQPLAVGRGMMNYIGALGLAPDMMDALTAVAVPDDVKTELGLTTRTGSSPTVGGIVPIVGYADTWLKAANNMDNPHAVARGLPFSNTPWLVPLLNLLRPDQ